MKTDTKPEWIPYAESGWIPDEILLSGGIWDYGESYVGVGKDSYYACVCDNSVRVISKNGFKSMREAAQFVERFFDESQG